MSGAGEVPASARPHSWLRRLTLASLVGLAALPLLPLITVKLPGLGFVTRFFEVWFELHCERDPLRTLAWGGAPWSVCARCAGVYLGLGLGAALRRPQLSPAQLRSWVLVAAALMLTDVGLELWGWHGPWAPARLLTGLLLAYPVGAGLGALLREPRQARLRARR